jgi:ABC-type transporter Mla subunit MlaD
MDLTYKQEVGVGALVLAGLVLFVVGLFWFSGRSIGHRGTYARVVFTSVAGLKEGDAVLISGVKVGRVSKVSLERVGRVTVTLELSGDPRVQPPSSATATVTSLDFFGTKSFVYPPAPRPTAAAATSVIVGRGRRHRHRVRDATPPTADRQRHRARLRAVAADIHNTSSPSAAWWYHRDRGRS